jgi:hypothetical protein
LALAIDIVLASAGVDPHIAVAPAQLLQDLPECRYAGLTLLIVRSHVHQYADPSHLLGLLLRSRRERPRDGCAAEKRNETRVSSIDRTAFGPRSQAGWEGYRIGMDQSAAIRIRL